ncbi:MAG: DUF4258 domain-containing protein [Chitinophagaceae bacterium]|jgi:hypothetical protein|nr:DUF4258 domain-containing protein [Chitinophagaceae bacterium]
MEFEYSKHCIERMQLRNILKDEVEQVIQFADKIIDDNDDGHVIYQKLLDGKYIFRIFVNTIRVPALIKTVYKTSKLSKYL